MYDKKFYSPGVVPTHGIGITGNKMQIAKGDAPQKTGLPIGKMQKKIRNKSLSKTAYYKNPLRGLSPETH